MISEPCDTPCTISFFRMRKVLSNGVKGFIPRNPLPMGIYPFTFPGIRPFQRIFEPIRIIQKTYSRIAFPTQASSSVIIIRIPFQFN